MSVTFIPGKSGNYQCLSTDMSGSLPVDTMSWIGANVFVTDTGEWYRVDENMYLVAMTYPISGSISAIVNGSDIQIGAVEIKDADTDIRVKVIQGSSIDSNDYAIAVHDANTISASLAEGGSAVWVNNDISATLSGTISASLVAGGSGIWVEDGNITVDGGTVDTVTAVTGITNTVSASLVAGGSSVYVEGQNISCTGFVSSITNDDLDPWITTTAASQVVNFSNTLNDLKIYASSSALYVQLNSGSHCIYIASNSNLEISGYKIDSITFSGASPVDFRYYGQYN